MGKVWVVGLLLVSLVYNGFTHCGPPINYSKSSNLIMVAEVVRKEEKKIYDTEDDTLYDFGDKYLFKPVKLLKGRRFRDTVFISFIWLSNEKFHEPFSGNYVIAKENSSGIPNFDLGDSIILYLNVDKKGDSITSISCEKYEYYGKLDKVIEEINQAPSYGLNEKKRHFNRRYRNVDTTKQIHVEEKIHPQFRGLPPKDIKALKELGIIK